MCVWPQLPFKYYKWQAKKSDFVDTIVESLNQDMMNECILHTSYEHDTNREDLLCVGVGWHVAKAHTGQTAEGEVEWGDVDAADGGAAAGPIYTFYGKVWWLQTLPQLMEPSCFNKMV